MTIRMKWLRATGATALLAALMLALAACGASSNSQPSTAGGTTGTAVSLGSAATASPTATAPVVQGQLTIFAAASLTDAFNQMKTNIEAANPGTKVTMNFAGSPTLRTQMSQGAPADVFASADQANMQGAQQDGSIAGTPQNFAQNKLVMIVPLTGSNEPTQLQDLARSAVKVVLAQPDVPVGNYARQAFQKMDQDPTYGSGFDTKVLANVVSQESDVKQVVAKVSLGEADAGICYSTDVTPDMRRKVKMITIPDQFNVIAQYPIAVSKSANNAAGAQQFVNYVLSPAGQQILKNQGFIIGGS